MIAAEQAKLWLQAILQSTKRDAWASTVRAYVSLLQHAGDWSPTRTDIVLAVVWPVLQQHLKLAFTQLALSLRTFQAVQAAHADPADVRGRRQPAKLTLFDVFGATADSMQFARTYGDVTQGHPRSLTLRLELDGQVLYWLRLHTAWLNTFTTTNLDSWAAVELYRDAELRGERLEVFEADPGPDPPLVSVPPYKIAAATVVWLSIEQAACGIWLESQSPAELHVVPFSQAPLLGNCAVGSRWNCDIDKTEVEFKFSNWTPV